MPETLADLTLKLSQEISSLEALGARELAEAERERDKALLDIAPAQAILTRYHRALEKAKQDQIAAVQEADERRIREIDDAEEERRAKLAREESSLREVRRVALARKNRATLFWLGLMVLGCASLSWFCKAALYPIFFKW